jgi:hypothetical protein
MTLLLRSFIVWLMLLALPYQGYASAAMMLCAPTSSSGGHADMSMPAGPHDHAAMMASTMAAMDAYQHEASSDTGHSDHAYGGVKCGGAACCVAGAPMMTITIAVPTLPAASSAVPLYSEVLHAVDLAHPERPPQGNFV